VVSWIKRNGADDVEGKRVVFPVYTGEEVSNCLAYTTSPGFGSSR